MKKNVRPAWPAPLPPARSSTPAKQEKPLSRVTLALMDEYSFDLEGCKGYDPYNTTIPPGTLKPRRR